MQTMVRDAVLDDADSVAEAHIEGWRVGYRGLVVDDFLDSTRFAEARRAGWRSILSGELPGALGPHDRIFVPVVDGRVVGFGHVGIERHGPPGRPERAELHGFYVHPDHWGTGVADALIECCHDTLERMGDLAILWVLRDNRRARRFYERNGWSCGDGAEVVEAEWVGPIMNGVPQLAHPLPEIEYRRRANVSD